jgi:PAS domain S-box-containing protein
MKEEKISDVSGLDLEILSIKNLIPSGVFTVDNDLKITSWNRQAEIITGYSEKEILDKSCLTFAIEPCKEACGLMEKIML